MDRFIVVIIKEMVGTNFVHSDSYDAASYTNIQSLTLTRN